MNSVRDPWRKDLHLTCEACSHDLSGSDSAVCSECGAPRGGWRFDHATLEQLQSFASALRLLRFARVALLTSLSGLVGAFVFAMLAKPNAGAEETSLSRGVIDLCVALGVASPPIAAIILGIGLRRATRATEDDPELTDAAKSALRVTATTVLISAGLLFWRPSSATKEILLAVGSLACALLAFQLFTLARLRSVCDRREGAAQSPIWPTVVVHFGFAVGFTALLASVGWLLHPAALFVFLLGNATELAKFKRAEVHIRQQLRERAEQ